MTPLLLLGASGLAREVLALVEATGSYRVMGILDDADQLRHTLIGETPVLGSLADAHSYPEAQLLVCIGSGQARRQAVSKLLDQGIEETRFATVIDPSIRVNTGCAIGPGSILLAGVVLTCSVTVGRHVVAMPNVTFTHDDVIEDFATLAAGTSLGGNVSIGSGAYLGMNSAVRQGVRVGPDAFLGMGAALLSDLPAGQTWVGVPARPLGVVSPNSRLQPAGEQS